MPVGRMQRRNGMLYTLIVFVGLFIITTTLAIVYYVKAEGHRTNATTLQRQIDELATSSERRAMGSLIGAKKGRKSRLGTMVDYLDETVSLIIGGLPEDTSAEVKVDNVNRQTKELLEQLANRHNIAAIDPNTIGLVRIIEKLGTELENNANTQAVLKQQLEDLQGRFDDAMAANFEKEQVLLAEKEEYQQQVNEIAQDYTELKALLEKTSEQQVQALMAQVDEERDNTRMLKQKLLKTQAELKIAEDRMRHIQEQLQKLVPPPDSEIAAFKADGKIILTDSQNKIVHLNIGSDDRIYRGLTFSVHDKNMPIPRGGRGKAEIEVFNVGKKISAARIISSEAGRPVVLNDIIANLIWDSDKTNMFVIAGDFDLNDDGRIDQDAVDKIKALVEKWGGKSIDTVSIKTDFLVLGRAPRVHKKPTFEEMEADPLAMEKYERSLQKLTNYRQVQSQAKDLGVPILNYERFLYFIGYKSLSDKPGAF